MTEPTPFDRACQTYREAVTTIETLEADNTRKWRDNRWRTDFERYHGIAERLPEHGREDRMRQNFPDLANRMAEILDHQKDFSLARAKAFAALREVKREALRILGQRYGSEISRSAPHDLSTAIDNAYDAASADRRALLDGKHLSFDPEGPFTQALMHEVATMLDLPTTGKKWVKEAAIAVRSRAVTAPFHF